MRRTSVSKLKATLSACLTWVKAGEELIVTERGKPIAKIVPLPRDTATLPGHLADLAQVGLVKIGSGKLPADFWELPRPKDTRGVGLQALLEERDTGR